MCYTCRILTPASNEVMCLYMIGLKKKKALTLQLHISTPAKLQINTFYKPNNEFINTILLHFVNVFKALFVTQNF